MGFLYKLTSPSGKSYIGITSKTVAWRWKTHIADSKKEHMGNVLYKAIKKYGPDAFVIETIGEYADWNALCAAEIEAITAHGTHAPSGYNICNGGEGSPGMIHSAETRTLLSRICKDRLANDVFRALLLKNLDAAQKAAQGRWDRLSNEERAVVAKMHGDAVREGHKKNNTHEKMVSNSKARWNDPEYRKRVVRGQNGTKRAPWTDERKARSAEKRRQEWADPVMREKRLRGFAAARER